MIPIFHATGHIFYAKCAHMYSQDCVSLKEELGETDYNKLFLRDILQLEDLNHFGLVYGLI